MRCRVESRDGMRDVDYFISSRWILVHLHHSFCIDSQRLKRDINEHLRLREQCFLGRSLDGIGVESRGGNVPMCCDGTSCSRAQDVSLI